MTRSSRHPIPPGCSPLLTIVVFPLLIYLCQQFGKFSSIASSLAGMLLILKIVVELRHHLQQSRSRMLHPRSASPARRVSQNTLAACYFCEERHRLHPYTIDGMRIGVCQHCYINLRFSRQYT